MNKFVGVIEGEDIFLFKCLDSKSNLFRNRRVVCLGVIFVCNCFVVIDFKYFLIGKDVVGLFKLSVAF